MTTIYISLGSNIERHKHINAGVAGLLKHFEDVALSPVYESEAVGFEGSHFYNLVASAKTSLSIAEVVAILKEIEDNNGRVRGGEKFSARTLDLDLLMYDQQVCDTPVELPRDEILYNAFVLRPLQDIAPQLNHPQKHQTMAQLWQGFDSREQSLWPVDFDWHQVTRQQG